MTPLLQVIVTYSMRAAPFEETAVQATPDSTLAFDSVVTAPLNFPQDVQDASGKSGNKQGGACDLHGQLIVPVLVLDLVVPMCCIPAGSKGGLSLDSQATGNLTGLVARSVLGWRRRCIRELDVRLGARGNNWYR